MIKRAPDCSFEQQVALLLEATEKVLWLVFAKKFYLLLWRIQILNISHNSLI